MIRKIETTVSASVTSYGSLSMKDQQLIQEAATVRLNAQAPYSHYLVGAALFAQNDPGRGCRAFTGCNVERASYTQTTHAEQNAIDSMVAMLGPHKITTIAIVGGPESAFLKMPDIEAPTSLTLEQIGTPSCGHCLQCIWENCMGDPTVRLLWLTPIGLIGITTIGSAFPMRFGPADLGITF